MPLPEDEEKEVQQSMGILKIFNPILKLLGFGDVAGEAQRDVDNAMKWNRQARDANEGAAKMEGPQWEPIHGVTLDQYAEISGKLFTEGVVGPEAVQALAEQHGVPPGKWQEVQIGWTQRTAKYPDVGARFSQLQQNYMR